MSGSVKLGVNLLVQDTSEMDESGLKIEGFLRSAPFKFDE